MDPLNHFNLTNFTKKDWIRIVFETNFSNEFERFRKRPKNKRNFLRLTPINEKGVPDDYKNPEFQKILKHTLEFLYEEGYLNVSRSKRLRKNGFNTNLEHYFKVGNLLMQDGANTITSLVGLLHDVFEDFDLQNQRVDLGIKEIFDLSNNFYGHDRLESMVNRLTNYPELFDKKKKAKNKSLIYHRNMFYFSKKEEIGEVIASAATKMSDKIQAIMTLRPNEFFYELGLRYLSGVHDLKPKKISDEEIFNNTQSFIKKREINRKIYDIVNEKIPYFFIKYSSVISNVLKSLLILNYYNSFKDKNDIDGYNDRDKNVIEDLLRPRLIASTIYELRARVDHLKQNFVGKEALELKYELDRYDKYDKITPPSDNPIDAYIDNNQLKLLDKDPKVLKALNEENNTNYLERFKNTYILLKIFEKFEKDHESKIQGLE